MWWPVFFFLQTKLSPNAVVLILYQIEIWAFSRLLCTSQLLFCQLQQQTSHCFTVRGEKLQRTPRSIMFGKEGEEGLKKNSLLSPCLLYSQSLSLHQSCSFHFPCCSGTQQFNCLAQPLLQPLQPPKLYFLAIRMGRNDSIKFHISLNKSCLFFPYHIGR